VQGRAEAGGELGIGLETGGWVGVRGVLDTVIYSVEEESVEEGCGEAG